MRALTAQILVEEAERYFSRQGYSFDFPHRNPANDPTPAVFPSFVERKRQGINDSLFMNYKATQWVMDRYINVSLELAEHMISNGYPTEKVLGILPAEFSSKVAERLGKEDREAETK